MHFGCLTMQVSQGAGHPQSQGAAGQHGSHELHGHAANDWVPINIAVKMPNNTKVFFMI